ncbi:unnamed protein product, partial [Prorocentrum cordatum]
VMAGGKGEDGPLGDVWRSWDGGLSWEEVAASAPWAARSGAAAVAVGREEAEILLLGGFAARDYLADVWLSADAGQSWSQVCPAAPWAPRYCHAAVAVSSSSGRPAHATAWVRPGSEARAGAKKRAARAMRGARGDLILPFSTCRPHPPCLRLSPPLSPPPHGPLLR